MKVLVTGGAGYIGSVCVLSLIENGDEVVIFDNCSTGHMETAQTLVELGNVEFEIGELQSKKEVDSLFNKHNFDAVIHFAAFSQVSESVENPRKYYMNNVAGSLNLLENMLDHGINKIVFSSTASVYGDPQFIPINEAHVRHPMNPYGRCKSFIEDVLKDYDSRFGLRSVRLRYFNVVGADNQGRVGEWHTPETHLVPNILKSAFEEGHEFQIFGNDYPTKDGTCIRDYVDVEDLANAHILALTYLRDGGESNVFNIGTNNGYSVKEVFDVCQKIIEKPINVIQKPRREGDPAILIANSTKAKQIINWEPTRTLEDSVRFAYQWMKILREPKMQEKVKIALVTHKPFAIPKCASFVPLHAGRMIAQSESKDGQVDKADYEWLLRNTIGDDSGDNISDKNRYYCEASAMYWMWKNYRSIGNPEYVGLMHYRRFFIFNDNFYMGQPKDQWHQGFCYLEEDLLTDDFANKIGLSDAKIEEVCNNYDIIVTKDADLDVARGGVVSLRADYDKFIFGTKVKDFDLMVDIIKGQYPRYAEGIDEYINGSHKSLYQMFIMKKEMFFEYCSFVFGVLSQIESQVDFKDYTPNGKRSLGYLAEEMLSLFVTRKIKDGARVLKLGVAYIRYPYERATIEKMKHISFNIIKRYLLSRILSWVMPAGTGRDRVNEKRRLLGNQLISAMELNCNLWIKRFKELTCKKKKIDYE